MSQKATSPNSSNLNPIQGCYIIVPGPSGNVQIRFNAMPTLTDQKKANYNEEPIIGRTQPLITYSHSSTRSISIDITLVTTNNSGQLANEPGNLTYNIRVLRALESLTYPRVEGVSNPLPPFRPPPVCKLRCGEAISPDELCVILDSYQTKVEPSVPLDPDTLFPLKLSVSTNWFVVYRSDQLPGQERIFRG